MSAGLRYRRLGEAAYEETLAAMRRFTDERGAETPDERPCAAEAFWADFPETRCLQLSQPTQSSSGTFV